jgi:hypothetical protein
MDKNCVCSRKHISQGHLLAIKEIYHLKPALEFDQFQERAISNNSTRNVVDVGRVRKNAAPTVLRQ